MNLDILRKLFKVTPHLENKGIILGPNQGAFSDTAYVAGVSSPIVYKNRLPDGDWSKYTWSKVAQWCWNNGVYVDQLSCTTNALITAIEAQEYFFTGKQVKYSRRWVAKMSGTNQGALKGIGNYMDAPAEWIRKNGLILESSYTTPNSYSVDEFYKDINPVDTSLFAKEGQQWLNKWTFNYEFLQVSDPNLDYHLKHAPISVVIPGHDICGMASPSDLVAYRDSYSPWDKETPISNLKSALKGILTPKGIQARQVGWKGSPEIWVMIPMDSMERLDYIKQNLSTWLPDYSLDSTIKVLPISKPF